MAVLQMQRISICGLKDQKKGILETLQRLGNVQVKDFVKEDDVFKKPGRPLTAAEFERSIHDAENALDVLNTYEPDESSGGLFSGREFIEVKDYHEFALVKKSVTDKVDKILALNKKIAEQNAEITKNRQQIEMLEPWKTLDVPLNLTGTASTGIFIGTLPNEWTLEKVYEILADFSPNIDANIISSSKEQTCIMVICEKKDQEAVSDKLRGHAFSTPAVDSSVTPSERQEELQAEIESLQAAIEKDEEEIKTFVPERDNIKFLADFQAINQDQFNVSAELPQSEHAFVLSGYTPANQVEKIKQALSDYDVEIETEAPGKKEKVPVVFKNNPFSAPMENVVSSYALPKKGEIDPSFLMSLFYYVFFGFMLSDFAFGAILAIGCLVLLLKKKNMEKGTKRLLQLVMGGGISAMFWGIMFGSYFGDCITTAGTEFFRNGIAGPKPLWLDMQSNPMTVLTLSLALGLLHIFVGLGAGAFQAIKQKDMVAFFFDYICWYLIIIGFVLKMLNMKMIMDLLFNGSEPLVSARTGNIGLILVAIGAIGVLIFAGRSSKSIAKRGLKGVYALYGITGYLSDLLSYSRLLALGLATGVIASVAGQIGTMFGSGVIKVIVFLVIFFIINAINIFINGLGAYVHTNRLMYVEFFGKFYEGGGQPFEPYEVNTKYYKFKEK